MVDFSKIKKLFLPIVWACLTTVLLRQGAAQNVSVRIGRGTSCRTAVFFNSWPTPHLLELLLLAERPREGIRPKCCSTINSAVSALRFLFLVTLKRRDLARALVIMRTQRKLPEVLSVEEAARLLEAAPGLKYKAALGVAYGAGLPVGDHAPARDAQPSLHQKISRMPSSHSSTKPLQVNGGPSAILFQATVVL